jgi:hypothetical protein
MISQGFLCLLMGKQASKRFSIEMVLMIAERAVRSFRLAFSRVLKGLVRFLFRPIGWDG